MVYMVHMYVAYTYEITYIISAVVCTYLLLRASHGSPSFLLLETSTHELNQEYDDVRRCNGC